MSDLALYNYFRSSASYRVRIALHLKNLAFDYRPVHLLNNGGEQHKPEYRNLNPAGEVPTLVHQGKAISQSMAILLYLDEVFPQHRLFPQDPYLKSKVIQFCEGINCTQPYQNLKTQTFLDKEMGLDPTKKNIWLKHWLVANLESSEKMLQEFAGSYCFGGHVTAADLFLIPQLFAVQRFQIEFQSYPNISRVNENCLQLEAFQKAHPGRQIDTPEELRIKK